MHEPLAVVSMACRLPGGDNLADFWDMLVHGRNATGRLPESFVDRSLYFTQEKGVRGKSYSDVAGLIDNRPIDWSIMPFDSVDAHRWDPCHLILCEVAARALRDAGYDTSALRGSRTGVYVGHSGGSTKGGDLAYRTLLSDYVDLLDDLPEWQQLHPEIRARVSDDVLRKLRGSRPTRDADGGPRFDAGCAAGLLNHAFGFTGPHMSIDAACASSLVALALSSAALHSGQIDMAIVGGASFNKFDSLILFSHAQSCSSNLSCPFDAAADGLISSEGYVVFVLKRLESAIAAGDNIHAVIRGIGVSSDGRGRSLWAPRKEGQKTAIERAYSSDITADSVQMVEAHATSTQVGDATEMEALSTFFRENLTELKTLPVGSVKSNIGHTLETAGLAGLVKAILSIQHGVIPPSIHVNKLNESIPWDDIPLKVAQVPTPWPVLASGQPRRAAVNAFGIGGLNVHVIVDQYIPSQSPTVRVVPSNKRDSTHAYQPQLEPVAVIGRGLVLPGALNVSSLVRMLSERRSAISVAPAQRWRALTRMTAPADHLDAIGGFITDFAYDWRKHKVPPKQIAQANPLQFMLLEAAEQAIREAGYLDQSCDRRAMAVVVGSVFGGDFGNSLYAGLRLPEFKRELTRALNDYVRAGKLKVNQLEQLIQDYEELFLKRYPALLDETGSFTSSTLASRLSKTFDLMGGAMAIDAGAASGLAALDASVNLLRSGTIDNVLCATAQSAMDRASFERLWLTGQLVSRGQYLDATPEDRKQLASRVPAEGVALLMLKRLADAKADGNQILATIHDVSTGFDAQSNDHAKQQAVATLRLPAAISNSKPKLPGRTMELTGNLHGAQALVDVIECTLNGPMPGNKELNLISQHAGSGLCYVAAVQPGMPDAHSPMMTSAQQEFAPAIVPASVDSQAQHVTQSTPAVAVARATEPPTIIRARAADLQSLSEQLKNLSRKSWLEVQEHNLPAFQSGDGWRASVVVSSSDYQQKLEMLSSQVGRPQSIVPMAEQGLYWTEPVTKRPKIAWLFPGQGSQYPQMLRQLVQQDPVAAQALQECNAALTAMGEPDFAQLAWSDSTLLGENVWHTQACVLVADSIVMRCLKNFGFAPDVVAGHSYGELVAMLAAGCWDLPTALKATYHRCRSIMDHVQGVCGMLSIQARADVVQTLIDSHGLHVCISHRNAPEQTVVGGKQSAVAQLVQVLENEGINSRLLAVPTAFHTPALSAAQAPFARALESIAIEPPRIPLLSNIDNRYAGEPAEMRVKLAQQLVKPLDFVSLVSRLVADGVNIVVEVGPQQVLTRLVRQIAGTALLTLACDHPKRSTTDQLLCTRAALELMMPDPKTASIPAEASTRANAGQQALHANSSVSVQRPQPVLHFDATAVRRERLRSSASTTIQPAPTRIVPSPAALHFDASQPRRDRNRSQRSVESSDVRPAQTMPVYPTQSYQPSLAPIAPIAPSVNTVANLTGDSEVNRATSGATSQPGQAQHQVIEAFLIDFVVEQTGYPAEIIELDWDIEADLGIDSIKKAQLFGELREFFDLESLQTFSLDSFKTLRDIVNLLVTLPGKGDWLAQRTESSMSQYDSRISTDSKTESLPLTLPTTSNTHSSNLAPVTHDAATDREPPTAEPQSRASAQPNAFSADRMQQFLIDFVVEQTGYPPEIVEMDADLEADLGIDSIKKAQLFGELREMFTFPAAATNAENRLSLNEFRTLRSVLDLLMTAQPAATSDSPQSNTNEQHASHAVSMLESPSTSLQATHASRETSEVLTSGALASSVYTSNSNYTGATKAAGQDVEHEPRTSSTGLQFRSLVTLESLSDTQSSLNDLPRALFTLEQANVNHLYKEAAFANLSALVGRVHRSANEEPVCYNGQRERTQLAVANLARELGAPDLSLLALDASVLSESNWQPARLDEASVNQEVHGTNAIHPLVDYIAPKWLAAAGVPLSMHYHAVSPTTGCIEWTTPGCVSSSVLLTSANTLLAGHIIADHSAQESSEHTLAHESLQLNAWLHEQAAHAPELTQFEKIARKLRLNVDWWVMCADLASQRRVLVECRDGTIVIEKGWLPSVDKQTAVSHEACLPRPVAARLYWDSRQQCILIQAHNQPLPYAASVTSIAVHDLPSAFADLSTTSVSSVSSDSSRPTAYTSSTQASTYVTRSSVAAPLSEPKAAATSETIEPDTNEITKRFLLRMVPSPQRPTHGKRPTWSGSALIIGDNPVATQLEARLRGANVPVLRWAGTNDPQALAIRFDELIKTQSVRHLFLTTPWDASAQSTLDHSSWQQRRNVGLMSLFWLCQRWHQHVLASGWVDDASLVAVSTLGGDFGISGNVHSVEGGALTGLLKSILIESWVQGFRAFPIKVIDTSRNDSPAQIVNHIWQELAVPSFDLEIAYRQGERHVVRAIARPLPASSISAPHHVITRGGNWICTGGARGITAFVAERLAKAYGLRLHLLGTAPLPAIPSAWRNLDDQGLRELKAQVMTTARQQGKNPVTTWQDTEKSLEIDHNLRHFREQGIEVHYYSCNVADRQQVQATLAQIRQHSGPIHGVLHGAGVGKDARFDRKQPEKVNQCIHAKIDGAWSLIEATWKDPLDAFVSFGSISGRFGANGHTDYSLANDMLCKQMDWLRSARPDVRAVGFHWHAWGDIGMATKPETKLALEMINMQFMPAEEGVNHLLRELASDNQESEVLITDDRYYRLFYAPEALVDSAGRSLAHLPPATPLLDSNHSHVANTAPTRVHHATLLPAKDPFLTDHRLDDRPLLPIVIGTELMLEAARAHLGHTQPLKLVDVRAVQGLRFYGDAPQTVRIATEQASNDTVHCRLISDFHARDGRLVERDRVNLTGTVRVQAGQNRISTDDVTWIKLPGDVQWHRPIYPPEGSKFYVGLPLQRLRGLVLTDAGLVGRITAPALIELAGGSREVRGWQLPSSAVDACLFATGILAWQSIAPGAALPVSFGEISLGRQPHAGEACQVHVRQRAAEVAAGQAAFDFTLYGVDNDVLVNVRDYRIAWLTDSSAAATSSATVSR